MTSPVRLKKYNFLKTFFCFYFFAILFSGCSILEGDSSRGQGELRQAIAVEELDRKKYTIPHGRNSSLSSFNFMLGELALKKNEVDKALGFFEESSREELGSAPMLRRRLAQIYLKKGDLDSALQQLSKAGDSANNDIGLLKLKAGILATQKKNKEAIDIYEKIIEIEKGASEEPYIFISSLYAQENDLNSAIKVLQRVLNKNPNSFFANYYSAKMSVASNDFVGAEKFYVKSIALNPSAESIQFELARVYAFQKRSEDAIALLEGIVKKNPSNNQARSLLGELLLGKERVDDALKEFEALESLEKNSSETRFRIALIKLQRRDLKGAEVELNLILADDPSNSAARYYLASAFAGMKRIDEAINQVDLIEDDQKYYRESRMLAIYIHRQGSNSEEALPYVDNLLEKTSEDIPLLSLKASLQKDSGDISGAIDTIDKIIFLDPNNDRHFFNIAVYYDENEQRDEAIDALEKAIEINPKNASALNYLGYTFAEENRNLDRAELLIERALEVDPGNAYYLDSLGWVYYMREDYQKALEKFSQSVKQVDTDAVIMEHYGITLLKVGSRVQGIKALKKALLLSENIDDTEVKVRIQKALREAETF